MTFFLQFSVKYPLYYPYILMNSHFLRVAQGYNLYKLLIFVKYTPSKLNPPKTAAWLRIDLPKNCRVSFIYNGLSTGLIQVFRLPGQEL